MADPTELIQFPFEVDPHRRNFVIKDAEDLVVGGFTAIDETTGEVEFAGTDAHVPAGVVVGPASGIEGDLTGDSGGTKEAIVRGNIVIEYDVTGVTGIDDIGDDVFATDGQTLNLTNPGSLLASGIVIGHVSGTKAKVLMYSYLDSKLKA